MTPTASADLAHRRPIRPIVVITAVLCITTIASARLPAASRPAQQPVSRLEAGKDVTHEISAGERHAYHVALAAGEYATITVLQAGVDVTVRTIDPDGKSIGDFQDELGTDGEEHVTIAANVRGDYSVVVAPTLTHPKSAAYTIRLDGIRTATAEDRTLQEARTLVADVLRLLAMSDYADAIPLVARASALVESARGPDDLLTAKHLRLLAHCYQMKRDYVHAQPLFERAIAILERTLGTEHPLTAEAWDGLASTYEHLGKRPQAEKLVARALDVYQKAFGDDHPLTSNALTTQANIRLDAGDLAKADELYRRALLVSEHTESQNSMGRAALLNNLGNLALEREEYPQAAEFLAQALAIQESLLGPDPEGSAIVLNNLGVVARERKDYAKAEEYYRRALSIRERALAPDHPDIASNLSNLATIYRATGDTARALEMNFRALAIFAKTAGPYSSGTVLSLGNIARTYAMIGDVPNALAFQRRVDSAIETQLTLNLAIGSERQKLAFAESISDRTDRTISLHLSSGDPAAGALAMLVILQRKGRVLDAMTDSLGSLRQRIGNAADQELVDRLHTTTAKLARLAMNTAQNMPPQERLQTIAQLEADKENLEAEISEHSAEFRSQSRTVTLEAIQAAIPRGAALVEFARFRPFDPKAERNLEAYGAPHYVAYVLGSDGVPRGRDLGPVEPIDRTVAALLEALRDPQRDDVSALARTADHSVLQPIRAALGDATRLLISPDGLLNLMPFEVLRDEQGRYAVERYAISYLTSGRDLLRMQVARASRSGPIVVADPDFGEATAESAGRPQSRPATTAARRSVTSADDLAAVYFAPLAGTAREARTIGALFPDARVLTQSNATKLAVMQVTAPSILHIATHAFFIRGAPAGSAATAGMENPLLRSGLALSGANRHADGARDGILTALEAANLNLWGTKLVTLSACDTGVGEVRSGEGVYGLRRAFVLAGAETLVMSLWPVSDAVTRELMSGYYRGLQSGLGRGDALRATELAMLSRPNRRHPFYWASFIQAGEWANLSGHR